MVFVVWWVCGVCFLQKRNPSTTAVSSVMTPNPEAGTTSMTVVDALQQVR